MKPGAGPREGLVREPGKLVRDKIPDIIRSKGAEPIIRVADGSEYQFLLRSKLVEEVEEFLASDDDPEELADILQMLLHWPSRRVQIARNWRSCVLVRSANA